MFFDVERTSIDLLTRFYLRSPWYPNHESLNLRSSSRNWSRNNKKTKCKSSTCSRFCERTYFLLQIALSINQETSSSLGRTIEHAKCGTPTQARSYFHWMSTPMSYIRWLSIIHLEIKLSLDPSTEKQRFGMQTRGSGITLLKDIKWRSYACRLTHMACW